MERHFRGRQFSPRNAMEHHFTDAIWRFWMRGVRHDARIHDQPHRAWQRTPTINRRNAPRSGVCGLSEFHNQPTTSPVSSRATACLEPHANCTTAPVEGHNSGESRREGGGEADIISVTFSTCTPQGFAGTRSGSTGNPP